MTQPLCPEWCAGPPRCSVAAGPAGVHRSSPFPLATPHGDTLAASWWQAQPTDDMPDPQPQLELLVGTESMSRALARQRRRNGGRHAVRAQLRAALTLTTTDTAGRAA